MNNYLSWHFLVAQTALILRHTDTQLVILHLEYAESPSPKYPRLHFQAIHRYYSVQCLLSFIRTELLNPHSCMISQSIEERGILCIESSVNLHSRSFSWWISVIPLSSLAQTSLNSLCLMPSPHEVPINPPTGLDSCEMCCGLYYIPRFENLGANA